ncbi:hypothetical protein R3W88_011137 [Solanum pinnatisectum]|uniref:Uncharacterized protein n=1 Tax=Solanum pinnatisectum TaxID=50273 RepID=A0AAV9L7Z1_9SOLN|nr:hypothetical protein R3W88_011137 [Solanum pinnatisectum]
MAEFIEDTKTKNKSEDPSISLVSDGKSSNEPSKVDQVEQVVETQEQTETEEEEEDADDEERANFSTPPGKRSAPKPKTG